MYDGPPPPASRRKSIGQSLCLCVSISIFLAMPSPADATVGCSVIAATPGAETASLYLEPKETSDILREIPLGDIVQYPAQELAPVKSDYWIWVRHDSTQKDVWTSGTYGWMRPENISDVCG